MDESQDLSQSNVEHTARMLEEASRILRESLRSLTTVSPPVNNGNQRFWSILAGEKHEKG